MIVIDAINTLGLTGKEITKEDVKKAYLNAAKKYHPDINPAGETLMKLINEAKETLFKETFPIELSKVKGKIADFGEAVNEALNKIINIQGISIEVIGSWIWVSGDTKPHWPTFKEAGFSFAPKKQKVFFRPEDAKCFNKGKTLSLDEIRQKYGSQGVKTKRPYQLTC